MILADCCFNATHESFSKDLDNVYRDANSVGVEYFFSPTSQESEIETLLSESLKRENLYIGIGIHPHHASELRPQTKANLLSQKITK